MVTAFSMSSSIKEDLNHLFLSPLVETELFPLSVQGLCYAVSGTLFNLHFLLATIKRFLLKKIVEKKACSIAFLH